MLMLLLLPYGSPFASLWTLARQDPGQAVLCASSHITIIRYIEYIAWKCRMPLCVALGNAYSAAVCAPNLISPPPLWLLIKKFHFTLCVCVCVCSIKAPALPIHSAHWVVMMMNYYSPLDISFSYNTVRIYSITPNRVSRMNNNKDREREGRKMKWIYK